MEWPPDHLEWPPDHLEWPPDRLEWPPDHSEWPPDHLEWPPDRLEWPPDHLEWLPDHFEWPPDYLEWLPERLEWESGNIANNLTTNHTIKYMAYLACMSNGQSSMNKINIKLENWQRGLQNSNFLVILMIYTEILLIRDKYTRSRFELW